MEQKFNPVKWILHNNDITIAGWSNKTEPGACGRCLMIGGMDCSHHVTDQYYAYIKKAGWLW